MIEMFKAIFRSFGYAFCGLFRTVREERNFRIHLVAVVLVTWFAFLYEVSAGQAVALVILYALVLSLELINTAVENAVDLASKGERSESAKRAKDSAAASVLVSAIGSVIVAVILFRDPVHWALVGEKMQSPVRIAILILFIILALFFVRGKKVQK